MNNMIMAKFNHNFCHIARPPGLLIVLAVLLNLCQTSLSDLSSESEILRKFKGSLLNNNALSSWNDSKLPCPTGNWAGVYCLNNTVWGLKLENLGLKGNFKVEMLRGLRGLRTMSVSGNELEGEFPDLRAVSSLKSMYMSDNKFSGEIKVDAFSGMISLKKFHAARNQFIGPIPASLAVLPRLIELKLQNNRFSGEIPNFQQNLYSFNVSNNQLEGPIPDNLLNLGASSFTGNKNLCGGPMASCHVLASKLSVATIVLSLVAAVSALVAIIAAFVILRQRRQLSSQMQRASSLAGPTSSTTPQATTDMDKMEQGSSQAAAATSTYKRMMSCSSGRAKNTNVQNGIKLTFLRDDRPRFDLADLLRASAEILGSGVFGSTYKADMGNGRSHGGSKPSLAMVVKRYKQMNNVGREEFQEHMRMLGKFRHPNLLPLVAYYYRKEEKLLVSDYVANGSLAVHLHGGGKSLDWGKRLRIVKGVARGLAYLYHELPSLIAPHGHLKSANVVLNEAWEPLLTDYGLSPIVNQEDTQDLMIAYKSPEYKQLGRITKKTDVWTLGILILEILTGRFPANTLQQGKGVKESGDTATWVESLMKEDENWKSKVFDKDMMINIKGGGGGEEEEEMLKLLKIGLACCVADVDTRLDIKEAVERIENVKETDQYSSLSLHVSRHHNHPSASKDEDFYTSCASEADMRSCRGLSDDFSNSWNP